MENNKISSEEKNNIGQIFLNKYKCIKKIGEGSFGMIYKAEYNNNFYAMKLEIIKKDQNLLENEAIIMNYLKGPNIPYIKEYGTNSNYHILVMQLLGRNLESIFEEKKVFSLKTVCMIGYQFISILEYIHNRHIIHRDIKPDNFVMGLNELSQYIYILDFGLAKKYRSSKTLKQFPYIHRGTIIGTARYASINALKGYELSRRDDIESVGYVLIYFLKGRLPWQGISAKTKEERYKKILEKKLEISSEELCEGLPEEFEAIIEYAKNLEYLEQPDYEMIRGYFNSILRKEHYKFDYIYDWTTYEERLKRRVVTPRSEMESTQNKKTTLVTYKYNGNSRDENNDDFNNNLLKKKNNNNIHNNNVIIEENDKTNSIINVKTYKHKKEIKEEEEEIIIPQRQKNYNNKEEEVCCSDGCIIV